MAVAHEVELGQVTDDLGIDRGLEVEVELLQGLAEREVGEAQPGREPTLARGVHLGGDHLGQELERVFLRGARLFGQLGEHLLGAGELQVAEVVLDLLDEGRLAHDCPPKEPTPASVSLRAAISTGGSMSQ